MSSAMLGLLSLQFLLGIISNLYFKFPDTTDQAQLWKAAWGNVATASHLIIGTVIVLLGLVMLIQALRSTQKIFSMLAIIAFVLVLLAAFGGEEFVRTQSDGYSVVMAVGFIGAMGVYGRLLATVLVAGAKQPPSQSPTN